MDETIMTPEQQLRATALAILAGMDPDEIIVEAGTITVADIATMTRNREWIENGPEGVALIESQYRQQ